MYDDKLRPFDDDGGRHTLCLGHTQNYFLQLILSCFHVARSITFQPRQNGYNSHNSNIHLLEQLVPLGMDSLMSLLESYIFIQPAKRSGTMNTRPK